MITIDVFADASFCPETRLTGIAYHIVSEPNIRIGRKETSFCLTRDDAQNSGEAELWAAAAALSAVIARPGRVGGVFWMAHAEVVLHTDCASVERLLGHACLTEVSFHKGGHLDAHLGAAQVPLRLAEELDTIVAAFRRSGNRLRIIKVEGHPEIEEDAVSLRGADACHAWCDRVSRDALRRERGAIADAGFLGN